MIILAIVMGAITLWIMNYFFKASLYGDDDKFYVVGMWVPGIIGMVLSVGLVLLCKFVWPYPQMLFLPIGLFVICPILLFFNLTPIVAVDGDEAILHSFKAKIQFCKSEASIKESSHGALLTIEDYSFDIYRGSVNLKKLQEWVNSK